jgi:Cu-Zn family superoxide dismutase
MRRWDRLLPAIGGVAALVLAGAAVMGAPARHAEGTFINASGNPIGWVKLVEDAGGRVHVNAHVEGLTAGAHGIHIHAVGSCSPTFAAAGGHYDPFSRQHGLLNPSGPHAGDLTNLDVNSAGVGHLDATTDRITLGSGPATLFDRDGSAFIIHANEDDQRTNATNGNSGPRVACAVIRAVTPQAD